MVVSLFKGLQRKRGYFNLEGDTERQLQDFEQDTDDSLRALSDQIDRVRTEAVESKEETQTEVTRVSEETSGQNAQIGDLDDRVTALEDSTETVLFMGTLATGTYGSNVAVTLETELTRGGSWTNTGTQVEFPVSGLYKFVIGGLRVLDNNTSTGRYSTADIRKVPAGGGGSVGIGTAAGAREATTTENVLSGAFFAQIDAGDELLIRFSSGSGTTISAAAFARRFTIEKVGD